MPVADSARIHATAVVSAEAHIAAGVEIGPFVVIDGPVTIGPECRISPYVHLVGPLTLGQGNKVGTGTVIGTDPQHMAYRGQPTRTEVGDFNEFREHVVIHRGSHIDGLTRIGSHGYFMANSHVAHDCRVGDHCILANGALMAGHSTMADRSMISGNAAIHQFCRMGRFSLVTGVASATRDVLPFTIVQSRHELAGVNVVGMKRAGISTADILIVKKAYQILCRTDQLLKPAVQQLMHEFPDHALVRELVEFIAASKRGVLRPIRGKAVDEGD